MSTVQDAWHLVEAGEYRRAIEECARVDPEELSSGDLRNRGLAHLLLGEPANALDDFEQAASLEGLSLQGDSDLLFQGVCHWYLARPHRAITCWYAGLQARYTDFAGGVGVRAVLYYGGLRLKDAWLAAKALGLLEKCWRGRVQRVRRAQARGEWLEYTPLHPGLLAWPGAVVPLLLGIGEAQDLQAAPDRQPAGHGRIRAQCQADFWSGVRALSQGDADGFRTGMSRAASSSYGLLEEEYCLARWEVERGFPAPAFGDGPG